MITLEGNHLKAISDSTEGKLSARFLAKTVKQRLSMQLRSGVLACPSCAMTQVLSSMWRGENSNFHQLKYKVQLEHHTSNHSTNVCMEQSTEISVYDYVTLTEKKGERAKHMDAW